MSVTLVLAMMSVANLIMMLVGCWDLVETVWQNIFGKKKLAKNFIETKTNCS